MQATTNPAKTPKPPSGLWSALLRAVVALQIQAAVWALGEPTLVDGEKAPGAFLLAEPGHVAPLVLDAGCWPGVAHVADAFCADVKAVTGMGPERTTEMKPGAILVATLGRGELSRKLEAAQPELAARLRGRWEAYVITRLEEPFPGAGEALVVWGSDRRGTCYALFDLSEQMGVSPWNWWADVPPERHDVLAVRPGVHEDAGPAVKYRGIFLNDEAPALTGWAKEKFGGMNHAFYTRLFELLLRLRANYLWPAMWANAFNEDDPLNPELADEWGIVMGTSHHEPMMRSQQEWKRHGKGAWDYAANGDVLRTFWEDGVKRNRNFENLYTLGMRGDGDEPMTEGENVALLEKIIADQRELLAKNVNPDLQQVPQLWALYKEVQGYYERGMRVPDDVTLLWCDDNWGNIRRLPAGDERHRSGGAGVYYHFDYVGVPRSYKWLTTIQISKAREQLGQALERGADRVWIVNVGDLKLLEFPTEFFLTYARHPERWGPNSTPEFTRAWAAREFGRAAADEAAYLVENYTRLNALRKPELLEPETFSQVWHREAERVGALWSDLENRALALEASLPPERRDAFFQLVRFPVQASSQVARLHLAAGRNRLHALQGRASANESAALAEWLFESDRRLTAYFNDELGGGRWRHFADQTHLGYTYWQQPPVNVMPAVKRVQPLAAPSIGVAIEGSRLSWPSHDPFQGPAVTTELHRLKPLQPWIEVFRRGLPEVEVVVSTPTPWLKLSWTGGLLGKDVRIELSADWKSAPVGRSRAEVCVSAASGEKVIVEVPVVNEDAREAVAEADGDVWLEAARPSRALAPVGGRWEILRDFGAGPGAATVLPVSLVSAATTRLEARLEFDWYSERTGQATLQLRLAPGLDNQPGRLRCAVSLDDGPVTVLDVASKTPAEWEEAVKRNARLLDIPLRVASPGRHTLRYWFVDTGVVLERARISFGSRDDSYLGAPVAP